MRQYNSLVNGRSSTQYPSTQAPSNLAVGETIILLHPLLPSVGVSIGMDRECQQNDSLAASSEQPGRLGS